MARLSRELPRLLRDLTSRLELTGQRMLVNTEQGGKCAGMAERQTRPI